MLADKIVTPTEARNDLFNLLKDVVDNHKTVLISRRDGENVAVISESDLSSLVETAYLLRSPANAKPILKSLEWSKSGQGKSQTMEELKQELGIE
jgi:antitoxin YefM